jgi:medium-chain acyl-[acyl-carrier-protein] hydrolase
MPKMAAYEYKVQPIDIGFRDNIRFTQLGGYLLHAAGENAHENGFGIDLLHRENLAWVLSRFAVEMERYPKNGEQFTVETWIEDFGRVFTTRNFKVLDGKGVAIGGGSSVWCMIDMQTRKAVDIQSKGDYKHFATGIPSIIDKPIKVPGILSEAVSRHRIKYSDIDFNRHTNSMKYLEWMIDLFPMEVYLNQKIRRMDINYINEALFGDVVEIYRETLQPDQYVFDLRREEEMICRAQILFENDI